MSDIVKNPSVSQVFGKLDYTLSPAGPGGKHAPQIGNWLLAIPKGSKNQRWAYEFILWATSAKMQKPYAMGGGIPFRKSVLLDAQMNKTFPFFKAMADALAAPPQWRPRPSVWVGVEAIRGTHVNAALAGVEAP